MSADDASDPVLEALWQRVIEAWDDDRAHAAIIEHCVRAQSLPEIAGRYRALLAEPDRATVAQKKLDAIVVAATNLLLSHKTLSPGKVPLPITLSAFGVSIVLLAWLAWALWGKT